MVRDYGRLSTLISCIETKKEKALIRASRGVGAMGKVL